MDGACEVVPALATKKGATLAEGWPLFEVAAFLIAEAFPTEHEDKRSFVLTYYITDRMQFAGSDAERRKQILRTICKAAAAGVDYIQLREKDLCVREFEMLAREVLHLIRAEGPARLLLNHRTDVAFAVGVDGVHLTGGDIPVSEVRALSDQRGGAFLVAASCHSVEEVRCAESQGAAFAVLAPVFEKVGVMDGIGLGALRRATEESAEPGRGGKEVERRRPFPVFALGGVDLERAPLCAAAGARGIAGIRLFQRCSDLPALVRSIHSL